MRPQQLKIKKITRKNIDFSFASRYDDVIPIEIPFVAEYQVMNMALAYQALMLLAPRFSLAREKILLALRTVRWAGRMQQVCPEVYFDGAHNTAGIEEFLKTVRQIGGKKPLLLFSMVKEKDYATDAFPDRLGRHCCDAYSGRERPVGCCVTGRI